MPSPAFITVLVTQDRNETEAEDSCGIAVTFMNVSSTGLPAVTAFV